MLAPCRKYKHKTQTQTRTLTRTRTLPCMKGTEQGVIFLVLVNRGNARMIDIRNQWSGRSYSPVEWRAVTASSCRRCQCWMQDTSTLVDWKHDAGLFWTELQHFVLLTNSDVTVETFCVKLHSFTPPQSWLPPAIVTILDPGHDQGIVVRWTISWSPRQMTVHITSLHA